ncbi:MAG: hypothetical protein R3A10_17595 [Caldilineaceae bacterium]
MRPATCCWRRVRRWTASFSWRRRGATYQTVDDRGRVIDQGGAGRRHLLRCEWDLCRSCRLAPYTPPHTAFSFAHRRGIEARLEQTEPELAIALHRELAKRLGAARRAPKLVHLLQR